MSKELANPGAGLGRYLGNNPGPHSGAGSAPQSVREASKLSYQKRIPALEIIIDRPDSKDSDKIAAMRVLGQIGTGASVQIKLDNQQVLHKVAEVTGRYLSTEQFDAWWDDIVAALRDA